MTSTSSNPQDLMHTTAKWYLLNSATFRVEVADATYYAKPVAQPRFHTIAAAELEVLNPKLLDIALALSERQKTLGKEKYFMGHLLATTLELLSNEGFIRLNDKKCFGNIYTFRESKEDLSIMYAKGFEWTLEDLPVRDQIVTCVIDVDFEEHNFSKDELEKQYPGWEQRWTIGQSIDLPDMDLQKYIFSKTVTPSLQMPDITINNDL